MPLFSNVSGSYNWVILACLASAATGATQRKHREPRRVLENTAKKKGKRCTLTWQRQCIGEENMLLNTNFKLLCVLAGVDTRFWLWLWVGEVFYFMWWEGPWAVMLDGLLHGCSMEETFHGDFSSLSWVNREKVPISRRVWGWHYDAWTNHR